MKKLLIILFIFFSFKIYAIDIQPYWQIGEARFGGVFQNKKPKTDIEGSISAVKFFFYDLDTGLNFSLMPLYLDLGTEIKNDKNPNGIYIMSFINVELAFNTLYKLSDSNKYALTLFTSFHSIDPIKISRFQLNTGLEFAITLSNVEIYEDKPLAPKVKILSIRTGFRYMQKQPMFFFDIGIDLGSLFWALTPSLKENQKTKKQNR